MPFHQQHFHDAFKLCKILHGGKKNNSCGKQAEEKISTHNNTHTFILTTIFFNRWQIVCHVKSQAPSLKPQMRTRAEEVMRLHINQIICTGQILFKRKPKKLNFCRKKETLLNNSVTVTCYNFTFNICKNIAFIFNNNINRLLKNYITQVTKEKILTLNI